LKRVLIISTSLLEQELVEEVAKNQKGGPQFDFKTTASFGQDADWWNNSKVDLLILNLPEDEMLQLYYVTKMKRDLPRTIPLILITPNISQSLLQMTPLFSKVRILKSPLNAFYLYRAVIDITTEWKPGHQQIHPRYMTEQEIRVSLPDSKNSAKARLLNLSVGGAYFETSDTTLALKPTDVVKIEIDVPKKSKYEFEARIIWSKPVGKKGIVGFGCSFVDMDEVYQHLLKGL
jgi:hypothetical protein